MQSEKAKKKKTPPPLIRTLFQPFITEFKYLHVTVGHDARPIFLLYWKQTTFQFYSGGQRILLILLSLKQISKQEKIT